MKVTSQSSHSQKIISEGRKIVIHAHFVVVQMVLYCTTYINRCLQIIIYGIKLVLRVFISCYRPNLLTETNRRHLGFTL